MAQLCESPRSLTWLCGAGATGLGLLYLVLAEAPAQYCALNAGALALGSFVTTMLALSPRGAARAAGGVILALGCALLATSLFGLRVEGAARWLALGGLSVQISLLVLPAMAAGFAARPGRLGAAGIAVAALALALQPDRGMAGALLLSMTALAVVKRQPSVLVVLLAAATAFAITLLREDTLPAVPYVDRILYTAFEVHALAGAAVLGGVLLMLLPPLLLWRRDPPNRAVYAAFGAIWLGTIAAAALGNYPTPLVGYGGSAILGYLLGLVALPARIAAFDSARTRPGASDHGRTLKASLA